MSTTPPSPAWALPSGSAVVQVGHPDTDYRPGLPSLELVQAHHVAQVRAHPELGGCARGCWMLRSRVLEPVQIYLRVEAGKLRIGLHTLMEAWDPGPEFEVRPCDRNGTPVPWPQSPIPALGPAQRNDEAVVEATAVERLDGRRCA